MLSAWVTLLALSSVLLSCGRGEAQIDSLQGHVRAVIERLEAHPRDAQAALRAIAAYERDHAAELDALVAAARTLRRDLGTQAKRSLHARWTRETRGLRARVRALRGHRASAQPGPHSAPTETRR